MAQTAKINDGSFVFTIIFSNGYKHIPVNKSVIKALSIKESLLQWYVTGYLIYENDYEYFERPVYNENFEHLKEIPYQYRNDGRDLVFIRIDPLVEGIPDNSLPPEIFSINYCFSIYDSEDLIINGKKFKKLYLWEYDYQLMVEKNLAWSTTKHENATISGELSTGIAIKDLISSALNGNNYKAIFDDDNWDKGVSNIFWTSPAANTVEDDLEYMLNKHVASIPKQEGNVEYDFAILNKDRYTKKWQLIPFNKYLERSTIKGMDGKSYPGEYQLEKYYITDIKDASKTSVPYQTSPTLGVPCFYRDIDMLGWNGIHNYRFVNMAGIDNSKGLIDKPIYSNNLSNGSFQFDIESSNIESTYDFINKEYVSLLYGGENNTGLLFSPPSKKQHTQVNPFYSLQGTNKTNRISEGRSVLLKSFVMLNQYINFTVKGMSHRTSGRFITIDRQNAYTSNYFDKRFLGQWLTTEVVHMFMDDVYYNNVSAVKFSGLEIEEDINRNEIESFYD